MVSVVICTLLTGDTPEVKEERRELIHNCTSSLIGYDELIVFMNTKQGMGYCGAWNLATSMARGDYIILMSDDHTLLSGSLKDMCIPDTVTSPKGDNTGQGDFWGGMFCIPRNIYEKYGLYDMIYEEGTHYMDEDLFERYKKEGVGIKRVNVHVSHNDPGHTLKQHHRDISRNSEIFQERWKRGNSN